MYRAAAPPRPAQTRPDPCTAPPVVGDGDPQRAVRVPQIDPHPLGAGVLDGVGQHLAHREARRPFHGGVRPTPVTTSNRDLGVDEQPRRQHPYGVARSTLGEYRRMDAVHQVPQLGERVGGGLPGPREQCPRLLRVLLDERLDGPQVPPHGDRPRLRTVEQVPLGTPKFGGGGVYGVPPRLGRHRHALGGFTALGAQQGQGEQEVEAQESGVSQ